MHRFLLGLFILAAATLSAGCTADGGCSGGGCQPSSAIGVSPYEGRYIEGGHGWR